jgi:hypothetical protein
VQVREGITAVAFDLSNVVPLTQSTSDRRDSQDEVTTSVGDYAVDSLECGFDLVFPSAVTYSV